MSSRVGVTAAVSFLRIHWLYEPRNIQGKHRQPTTPVPGATPAPGTTSTGRRAARAPVIPGLIVTVAGHSIQTQSEIRETTVEAIIVKVTAESAMAA